MQIALFDVVELLTELPDSAVKPGDLGTIVEAYGTDAYEIEFANSDGEAIEMRALTPQQFVVVWQNETKSWVSMADRILAMMQRLPEAEQANVLDFARSLYKAS